MKFLIASDLHGSAFYAEKLICAFEREKADKIILLGDIYNHGPRNPLPERYNPGEVADILNGIKEKLIVVKGNCDSQVDTLISEFDFIENTVIISGNKSVFCTHGHIYNKDAMPKTKFDAVVYGHFHTGFIDRVGETVVANAGSLSLPKGGTANGDLTIEEEMLTLKNIDGQIIKEEKI